MVSNYEIVVMALAFVLLIFYFMLTTWVIRNQRTQIERQQDTIQRLINRDPVTYQETGQKQPKIIEEVYSAWGNVTIEREVDESR